MKLSCQRIGFLIGPNETLQSGYRDTPGEDTSTY